MNELKRWSIGVDLKRGIYQLPESTGHWVEYAEVDAYLKERLPKDCECDAKERITGLESWLNIMKATNCPYCGGSIAPKEGEL